MRSAAVYTCTMMQPRGRRPATPLQAASRPGRLERRLDPGLFRALHDPTRARLVACLARCGRACSVSELAACCSVDLSVVSRHLRLLERSGVVRARRSGRSVLYAVRYRDLSRALRALAEAFEDCRPDGWSARCARGCHGRS